MEIFVNRLTAYLRRDITMFPPIKPPMLSTIRRLDDDPETTESQEEGRPTGLTPPHHPARCLSRPYLVLKLFTSPYPSPQNAVDTSSDLHLSPAWVTPRLLFIHYQTMGLHPPLPSSPLSPANTCDASQLLQKNNCHKYYRGNGEEMRTIGIPSPR